MQTYTFSLQTTTKANVLDAIESGVRYLEDNGYLYAKDQIAEVLSFVLAYLTANSPDMVEYFTTSVMYEFEVENYRTALFMADALVRG